MNKPNHRFSELFAQLGLPDDAAGIARFVEEHRTLSSCVRLPDALFWSPAQAQFLGESLQQDADWCGLVDQLGQALQGARPAPHHDARSNSQQNQ